MSNASRKHDLIEVERGNHRTTGKDKPRAKGFSVCICVRVCVRARAIDVNLIQLGVFCLGSAWQGTCLTWGHGPGGHPFFCAPGCRIYKPSPWAVFRLVAQWAGSTSMTVRTAPEPLGFLCGRREDRSRFVSFILSYKGTKGGHLESMASPLPGLLPAAERAAASFDGRPILV